MPFQMYLTPMDARINQLAPRPPFRETDNGKLNSARTLIARALESYWEAVCRRQTPSPPSILPPPECVLHTVPTLECRIQAEAFAAQLPPAYSTEAAYRLTAEYASLLPQELRAQYGIFYTPPALTEHLLEITSQVNLQWGESTVLDPACGGGAFLAPVAVRKQAALWNTTAAQRIRSIGATLTGFEIDPFAAWMSRVLTELALIDDVIESGERLPNIVRVCDALRSDVPISRFDLVIGNPPYGRASLSQEERERYRRSLYGHANLYGLFTDLALRAAKTNGTVALVTPASYLAGQYFKNLRKTIREVASTLQIDFVKKRSGTFDGVLQETVLSVHKKELPRAASGTAHVLSLRKDGALHTEAAGHIYLPRKLDAPWIVPRTTNAEKLLRLLGTNACHLRDYGYKVRTGPLVWNRHRQQLRREKVAGAVPLVWAECVRPGGFFEFSYAKRNHTPFFLPEADQEWLLTQSSCVLLQRTTSKEQNRRLYAALLPLEFISNYGAAVIENHLNVVEPVKESQAAVAPHTVAFLLNSQMIDQLFRCLSGSVAVSAYEIEAMPLPDPQLIAEMETKLTSGMDHGQFERELEQQYGIAS